ncbi:MAG: hypothetical protein NTV52_33655 [Acidobacteria bacterium]|nr:hypothetical protein [Acidobacteriota bacterium]
MLKFWMNGPLMDDDAGAAGGGNDLAAMQAKVEALGKSLKAERERTASKAAEATEKERQSLIKHELTRRGVTGPVADDAFRFFRDELVMSEDGKLMSKDGYSTADDIFRRTLAVKRHWLPTSKGGTAPAPPKEFDMDQIKHGMSAATKAEAVSAINAALKRLGGR